VLFVAPLLAPLSAAASDAHRGVPSEPATGVRGAWPFCGFLESAGAFTTLQGLYFFGGQPDGINARDQIADPYVGIVDAKTSAVTPIAVPGAKVTAPFGINDAGAVVGYFFNGSADQGFLYKGGAFTTIVPPGATWSVAYGINAAEEVVGYYVRGSKMRGFAYRDGAYTTIDFPSAHYTQATGINDRGDVVGIYSDGTSEHGFLAKDFLSTRGTFTRFDPADSTWTDLYGIDNEGGIVGRYFSKDGTEKGFIFRDGAFTPLEFRAAVSTDAQGINSEGQIVGTARIRNPVASRRGINVPCRSGNSRR
jgi:hypothetical protein